MAIFLKKPFRAYGPDRVRATGQFTTAGTGQPTTFNLYGISSITRTGVGVFLVTLSDAAKEYHISVSRQSTAALADNQVVIGAIDLKARTVILTVASGGAAADTTAITIYVSVDVRVGS